MASASQLSGRVALISGLIIVSIGVGFAYLNGGITMLGAPRMNSEKLIAGFIVSALLYQFGTPFFCAAAFFFGIPARSAWSARIGIGLAAVALVPYVFFVRTCSGLITEL